MLRDGRVRVHGSLHDGRKIDYTLGPGVGPRSELVGQVSGMRWACNCGPIAK